MQVPWAALPRDSLLRACGPSGRASLAARWSVQRIDPPHTVVAAEGTGTEVYFVLSGRLRASTFSSAGQEVMFSHIDPGACFGEIAAIDGLPRSTNVIAVEPSDVARLSRAEFTALIDSDAAIRWAVLVSMASRLRALSFRIAEFATLNARQRLLTQILALAVPDGPNADSGAVPDLPTQQELANVILSQRETVGRELSRLNRMGLVRREGHRLRLLSLSGLRADLAAS